MSNEAVEEVDIENENEENESEDKRSDAPIDETELDAEIEALRKRVKERIDEEDDKIKKMQEELESSNDTSVNKEEVDSRSIYVGNVDYAVTPEELQQHFHSCGTINLVTILCDKWTGHPKGFAYLEFADKDSVANAVLMNGTLLKGRQIKVSAKRTNVPGMKQRGGFRGGPPTHMYRPYFAPRRFRGSRRANFTPYM